MEGGGRNDVNLAYIYEIKKKITLCNTRSLIYQVYGRQMKFGHFLGLLGWGSKEDQQISDEERSILKFERRRKWAPPFPLWLGTKGHDYQGTMPLGPHNN